MPLAVGSQLTLDGSTGTVRAVVSTTDANGRGSVSYGGNSFAFRSIKAVIGETTYPLTASSDAVYRVGVVQQDSNPLLFCMVLDDGPAPGWGRSVMGKPSWNTASEYAAVDSVVFTMGWAPGTVTIKRGGTAVVSSDDYPYADLVFTWSTSDGEHREPWGPAYPSEVATKSGGPLGRFMVDDDGVLWDVSTGSQQPIIVPKGFAALGYRDGDGWTSCPEAERTLTKLEVWYLQEHAELTEGAATTLDVAACELTIKGPAGAYYRAYWEATGCSYDGTIPGPSGEKMIKVCPGEWHVRLHHPTDHDKGLPPKKTTCSESGGAYEIDFGGTWQTTAGTGGCIPWYGANPAPGVTIWGYVAFGYPDADTWYPAAVTDDDGMYEVDTSVRWYLGFVIDDPVYGSARMDDVATMGGWWDPALSGRLGGMPTLEDVMLPPGTPTGDIAPWGKAGKHINLGFDLKLGYYERDDGEQYDLKGGATCGHYTDPVPRWHHDADWQSHGVPTVTDPGDRYTYQLYTLDDEAIGSPRILNDDFSTFYGSDLLWYHASGDGAIIQETVGGKIDGNVVEASRGDLITVANLTEAARVGLETGKQTQPLEIRVDSDTMSAEEGFVPSATFTGLECPYCGGPVWGGPDDAVNGLYRGYCIPCLAYNSAVVDARTYFLPRTLRGLADWKLRVVKNTTAGGHTDKLVQGWPRPCEYMETNDYIIDPWEDGLARWVATHIILAQYSASTFTDQESIADAETRVGETIGPVQLKLQLTDDYAGSGASVEVTATAADGSGSVVLTGSIATGSQTGDLVFLRQGAHDAYPGSPCRWFTDVTNVEVTGQTNGLSFYVVNDGPSWRSSTGVIVTSHAYSPWACDASFGVGQLAVFHWIPRWGYVFYGDEDVRHVYSAPFGYWFANHRSQANYALPKTDWATEASSFSGYSDSNSRIRFYCLRSGALQRETSPNLGCSWQSAEATAITAADEAFVFPSYDGIRQHCLWISGGTLYHSASHDHFTTLDETETIASGVDSAQPTVVDTGQYLSAFALVGGTLTRWTSTTRGRTWDAAVTTPITGAEAAYVVRAWDGTRQHCVYRSGATLYHAASGNHFSAVQETETIAANVDSAQVALYDGGQELWAYGYVESTLTCWNSRNRGRTWALVGTVTA